MLICCYQVEIIEPAVNGTLNVLKACFEGSVKRVAYVSSGTAVSMNPNWPKKRGLGVFGLDTVTVCPTLVFGPMLQCTTKASSLVLIKLLKGLGGPILLCPHFFQAWVSLEMTFSDCGFFLFDNAEG
ncbi:hypothetical protein RJ639_008937 [Escallonia herrerae]|uniref:3-beta hydroxysteroid dehydrogenase/isomerase domain-containing protein n=1 Tax=Escallonia herrerae TaxID=1293975 RepID=A0AA88VVM5_9ASTE|nr:hypothetical protein RJ639_008937 [Escallonia herrerae]